MNFTEEQVAILDEKKNVPIQFEITTTQTFEFSIFALQAEISRIQGDIELAKKRIDDLSEKKMQLEAKLEEVKLKILEL